jgi:hypothetical protein
VIDVLLPISPPDSYQAPQLAVVYRAMNPDAIDPRGPPSMISVH